MNTTNLILIVFTLIILIYLIRVLVANKRANRLFELLFIGIFGVVLFFSFFPTTISSIENFLGISSLINLFVYISILVIFILIFKLYQKLEKQRIEITKLTRIIAFNNAKKVERKKQK